MKRLVYNILKCISWTWIVICGLILLVGKVEGSGEPIYLHIFYIGLIAVLIALPVAFLLWRFNVDKEDLKQKRMQRKETDKELDEEIVRINDEIKKLKEKEKINKATEINRRNEIDESNKLQPKIVDKKMIYEFSQNGLAPVYVIIDGNWLSIKREGIFNALNHGLDGAKKIHIKNITGVQFKEATSFITEGFIQLVLQGSHESKGGLNAARTDENSIMFGTNYNELAKNLVSFLEAKIDALQVGQNQCGETNHTQSVVEQLKGFKELLDSGIITQEEFNKQKEKLLGL